MEGCYGSGPLSLLGTMRQQYLTLHSRGTTRWRRSTTYRGEVGWTNKLFLAASCAATASAAFLGFSSPFLPVGCEEAFLLLPSRSNLFVRICAPEAVRVEGCWEEQGADTGRVCCDSPLAGGARTPKKTSAFRLGLPADARPLHGLMPPPHAPLLDRPL